MAKERRRMLEEDRRKEEDEEEKAEWPREKTKKEKLGGKNVN